MQSVQRLLGGGIVFQRVRLRSISWLRLVFVPPSDDPARSSVCEPDSVGSPPLPRRVSSPPSSSTAVKKHAGEAAAIQRCQVHKRRNVLDHLTEEQRPGVAKKLNAAYALEDYAAAKQALNTLHRELMDLNPSAARSLGEGMEETLTVHRLHLPMQLRKTMASTNVIESAFAIVEQVCRNVKRWHGGDQRERWVGSGLLVAEKQFRKVQGYKHIPVLVRELGSLTPNKSQVAGRRKVA